MSRGEFASDPCRTLFGRVLSRFLAKPTDNCNVSVNVLGRSAVALTETTLPVRFDPDTLETLGHYDYGRQVGGQVSIAHPHHDAARRCHSAMSSNLADAAATVCSAWRMRTAPNPSSQN